MTKGTSYFALTAGKLRRYGRILGDKTVAKTGNSAANLNRNIAIKILGCKVKQAEEDITQKLEKELEQYLGTEEAKKIANKISGKLKNTLQETRVTGSIPYVKDKLRGYQRAGNDADKAKSQVGNMSEKGKTTWQNKIRQQDAQSQDVHKR